MPGRKAMLGLIATLLLAEPATNEIENGMIKAARPDRKIDRAARGIGANRHAQPQIALALKEIPTQTLRATGGIDA